MFDATDVGRPVLCTPIRLQCRAECTKWPRSEFRIYAVWSSAQRNAA